MILRAAAGFVALGIAHVAPDLPDLTVWSLRAMTFVVAILLWVGLWTPVAAVAETVLQVCMAAFTRDLSAASAVYAALGLGLAMLGPGCWSLDARLFGRKRIV